MAPDTCTSTRPCGRSRGRTAPAPRRRATDRAAFDDVAEDHRPRAHPARPVVLAGTGRAAPGMAGSTSPPGLQVRPQHAPPTRSALPFRRPSRTFLHDLTDLVDALVADRHLWPDDQPDDLIPALSTEPAREMPGQEHGADSSSGLHRNFGRRSVPRPAGSSKTRRRRTAGPGAAPTARTPSYNPGCATRAEPAARRTRRRDTRTQWKSGSPQAGVGGLRRRSAGRRGVLAARAASALTAHGVHLTGGGCGAPWPGVGRSGVAAGRPACQRATRVLRCAAALRVTHRPSLRSSSRYGPCGPAWTGASRPSTTTRKSATAGGLGRDAG